jgi:putative transposase
MREWQSQSHVRGYCKDHIVFVPKDRRRGLSGQLRRSIGRLGRALWQQQGMEWVEGHAMPDHVPLCRSIPPQYRLAKPVGFLKGQSASRLQREFLGHEQNCPGLPWWARGYCVSTLSELAEVL